MIGEVQKLQKTVKKLKTVKPASFKDVETGAFEMANIMQKDGKMAIESKPIKQRIYVNAVREEVEEQKTVYGVQHFDEIHEFATPEEAERFKREAKG